MSTSQHIQVPPQGEKISVNADKTLNVPSQPIIPFIEGDGVGVDGQRVGECFWLFVRAAGVQSDHYAAERNGQQE